MGVTYCCYTEEKWHSENVCGSNMREQNKAIVMDSPPLPHMDDLISAMRVATGFSPIDLANTYHQVLLAEER